MSEQKTKSAPRKQDQTKTQKPEDLKNEELEKEVDALIDEIDEVLEENAEEFVKNYIQRGGE
jgi:prokaryotic ubiquitin-like protein Pup